MPQTKIDPRIRTAARRLRGDMTPQEWKLWFNLKSLRPLGIRFRRQCPIGQYVVDFAWLSGRLVIELDGSQHGFDENLPKDRERDAWLAGEGFRILRFWNHELNDNLPGVLDTVAHAALERQTATGSPSGLSPIAASPA